ncbi:MAG TPA: phosphatidylglycerol lysyltransferase domain-containing protein [Methanocella sp.]|nr:phosphatidylglycerol lysyltransferase domain-containing protein [Methanocella sp.]
MLSIEDFKPVTLEDRDFFRQYYAKYPQVHSDNTFSNMVCWNHYAHYHYAQVQDNLLLMSTVEGKIHFRPPIGPRNLPLLKELVHIAARTGDSEPIILIDQQSAGWMQSMYPRIDVIPDRDQSEYVYAAADLSGLQGRDYLYIRREINKFKRTYNYSAEPITPANDHQVKEFLDRWYALRSYEENTVASHEKEAVLYSLDHMAETGLKGLAIRVEGQIAAMAMFEGMSSDTALVHFEKGLPEYPGIYKVVNQETAALLARRFAYINRESDMGVPGLREAKLRYHPHHMVEVYTATRPKIVCPLHCLIRRKCNVGCQT